MTNHADVLIVGGGPAGSTCAWRLRRAGLDVLVLDRAAFPRDKICAGWVTPAVLEALEIDAGAYRRGYVLQEIRGFRTGVIGAPPVLTSYDRPVSYGVRRCEFDAYLLNRSDARVETGVNVGAIECTQRGWRINDRYEAPVMIGAGGHFCPVARAINPGLRDEPVVAAQEIEVQVADAAASFVDPAVPEFYFCPDLKGYGWVFQKGDYLNVGFGRQDRRHFPGHVQRFLDFLRTERRLDVPLGWHGHAYLLWGSSPRHAIAEGAMLVGDSAGLAYPQSGEGIRTAVESGIFAAETILDCAGDYAAGRLAAYAERLATRFGRPAASSALARLVPDWVVNAAGRRLLGTRWFSRRVILDRWFLHADQPALAVAAGGPAALRGDNANRVH